MAIDRQKSLSSSDIHREMRPEIPIVFSARLWIEKRVCQKDRRVGLASLRQTIRVFLRTGGRNRHRGHIAETEAHLVYRSPIACLMLDSRGLLNHGSGD
jgi:hypothetical protein